MACEGCKKAMHDQYKGYMGKWMCFHPGKNNGSLICKTPVDEWNDFPANNKRLAEAETPKWCPLQMEEG